MAVLQLELISNQMSVISVQVEQLFKVYIVLQNSGQYT